jgi:hypothetical protein
VCDLERGWAGGFDQKQVGLRHGSQVYGPAVLDCHNTIHVRDYNTNFAMTRPIQCRRLMLINE